MTAKLDSTPVSMIMAADLSTKLFRFGKHTSTGINVCTVAGERADGIIGASQKKTPVAGDAFDLYIESIMLVEAGAAYDAGVDLTTDVNGRAVTAGEGDVVNAVSIDAATIIGQVNRVRPPYAMTTSAGIIVDSVVAGSGSIAPGTPIIIPLTFADVATATYVYENDDALEIVDVWAIKDGAGAANTIQVTTIADVAITAALVFAVDGALTRAASLPLAPRLLTAGEGFKVVNTRAAGSSAGALFLLAIKR
jgi:hypothetical protein